MRGGIEPGAVARSAQDGLNHRCHGAFAFGARYNDALEAVLRPPQQAQEQADALQPIGAEVCIIARYLLVVGETVDIVIGLFVQHSVPSQHRTEYQGMVCLSIMNKQKEEIAVQSLPDQRPALFIAAGYAEG